MSLELFSWAIVALMIIASIVLLYGAVKMFKVKNRFAGIIYILLAAVIGFATYAIYGKMIIELFQK